MNITSVKVIRPGAVAVDVLPGEKIELAYGDTLKVNVNFDYRGLRETVTLFGAIGRSGFPGEELEDEGSFIKHLTGEQSIDLPPSLEFAPVSASVDISITTEISSGTNYDLYVKLVEYRREAGMPKIDNIIDILPEYELIQETIYPYAYVYDGKSELTTATFRTDPFSSAEWQAEKLADKLKEEMEKDGRRVLVLKAYADTTPLLWTDLRFEIETTLPPETATGGIVVGIEPVTLWIILGIILALIGLVIAIKIAVESIVRSFTHKPISEKIKKALPKPTLIDVTNAFEIKLNLTPTPVEELEGMSDQELRDYCDMLAEEIAPPGIDWLPWVIGAGIGVLGLGTVAVLAKKKK